MFTPKDLQEISFNKVRRGGYDMQSVDAVLEPLCQDYTKLYKENSVLKSKLKILVEKLEERPQTYHIVSMGCQMNERDSEALACLLEADGAVSTDSEGEAPYRYVVIRPKD